MSKTPKLRFKEFSGDWETGIISDYGYFYYGKSAPKWSITTDATIPCIRYGELYTTHNEIVKEIKTYTNISKENLKFSKGGEVLVPRVGEKPLEFSKCTYLPFKDIAIGEMISVYNTNQNPLFIVYYFRSKMKYKFARMVEGGNVSNLYYSYLEKIHVSIPSKEEQNKIASFFSLIDNKISLQGEKVEALKDYKKGMMQKIFSRELRFKDDEGRDYPEWEEKKLNELGDTYNGLSEKTKKNVEIGEIKCIKHTNVLKNIIAKKERIELVGVNKDENQNKVIKGDLLFSKAINDPNKLGLPSCWNYDVDDLYLNSFCFGYRLFDLDGYSPIFITYVLRSEVYRKRFFILRQGATRYNISKTVFMNTKVCIPFIDEQNKIASLLLDLENKIEKEQEKLDYLNEYKKGLLQQMFV